MISKKNSVLIFDPRNFRKNTLTDQNLTFPFEKHEIFGGVAHVSHMVRKVTFIYYPCFHMTTCEVYFSHAQEENIHKILLKLFRK